jgi:hypothetical protein
VSYLLQYRVNDFFSTICSHPKHNSRDSLPLTEEDLELLDVHDQSTAIEILKALG